MPTGSAAFVALLDAALAASASDIHLAAGETPRLRVRGELLAAPSFAPLLSRDIENFLLPLFSESNRNALQAGTLSFAETLVNINDFNVVVQAYRSAGEFAATLRILPAAVPTLAQVGGDHEAFWRDLSRKHQGLVLITGEVGSGKQTTAFALLQEINATRPCRIHLVEESLSHRLRSETAFVTSLLVGQDVPDFDVALRFLLRGGGDADVVYLSDLPTASVAESAVSLCRMGCLVIANAAAPSATTALLTLAAGLPDADFAQHLLAVTYQKLVTRGAGRIAEYDVLRGEDCANILAKE